MKLREGLSEPYRAEVTAFSEQPRTPAKLREEALGRRVSLRIVQDVEKEGTVTRYLCGIVTSVAHLGAKIQDAEVVSFCGTQKRRLSSYRLTIEPQLAQLAFTRRTLDYPDTTPLGVIKAVLGRNRISFDAGQYLDPEEYSGKVRFVQRDETDLAFIHRVMARYGISYTFTHGMVTVWNEDEEHPVYKFVSNGLYSREVNTFWLNYYTGPTQTSATRTTANKAPEEYRPFKQTYCMFMVESLTKVD